MLMAGKHRGELLILAFPIRAQVDLLRVQLLVKNRLEVVGMHGSDMERAYLPGLTVDKGEDHLLAHSADVLLVALAGVLGALFAAYILFAMAVFSSRGTEIMANFSTWNTSYLDEPPSLLLLLWTGILYVGYNLAVYPASFFTYKGILSRRESILAGFASATFAHGSQSADLQTI